MIIKTFTTLLTLLLQLHLSLAQFQGCPTSILSDPDSLGRLIAKTIDDQSAAAPSIVVTRNNTVCLSVGPDLLTISSFSIVVEYECRGHTACNHTTGSADTTIVEQFDFGCQITNGIHGWTAIQFGMAGSRVPSADFSTALRRNCSACIEIGVADALHIDHVLHIDPISRCLACSNGCADVGMGLCYGLGSNMCCNYLLNDSCVNLCPNTTQPNSNHNCKKVVVGFEEKVYLTDERDNLLVLPVVVKEGELTQRVTLLVTTQDRTSTVEVDYVMKNRKVQLIPGRDGGSGQVQVMIPNDYLLEDDEEFVIYLELQSGSSAFLDISSTIIVIIGDQDITEEPSDDSVVNTTMVTTSETPTPTSMIENGCEQERDEIWGLMWPLTAQEHTATITCGKDNKGIAMRRCMLGAVWGVANVSLCENVAIAEIGRVAEELFSSPDVHPNDALVVLRELAEAASDSASINRSQLPQDLITVSDIVAETVDLLLNSISSNGSKQNLKEVDLNETEVVLDVLNIILTDQNQDGFSSLSDVTQEVLHSAEKYNQYIGLAMVNDSKTNDHQMLYSGENIVLVSERINSDTGTDITFPRTNELQNVTRNESGNPVMVTVTGALLDQVYEGNVSVTNLFFRDLHHLLPTIFDNGTVPKSFVVSSEIYGNLRESSGQYPFKDTPIYLTYTLELSESEGSPRCAFWDFSNGIAESGWSTDGLKTESVTRDGNMVTITCSTIHLTSFAVLVDVSGGSKSADHKSLEVISYMGISISIACLFLTIIFFASIGKKLFSTVHNFVHLNLSISLFVAYVIFAIGIEVATSNEAACKIVAALIQYFLLSAFCWMMCEGIMLYLMLVVVFSRLKEKWWLFLMLGWGPPLIFVVIGLSTVLDEYGVRDSNGDLLYCWLASGNGKHAIWTFVAPMLAIITVNTVFLVLVIRSIYISRKSQDSRNKNGQKRYSLVVYIVKASLILLPLLGLTWLFGLFAVNENTVVFAWLFTIFNSLQGVSIFVFHVFRNDRVWGRFRKSIVDPDGFLRSFSRRTMRSSIGNYSSRFSKPQCDSEMEMKSHSEPMSSTSGITTHLAIDPEDVFEPRESTIITSPTGGSLNDESCDVTTGSDPPSPPNDTTDDPPLIDVPLNASTDLSIDVPTYDHTTTTAKAANGILSYKI